VEKLIGSDMDNGHIVHMYVDEVKGIEFDKVFVVSDGMSRNEKYIAFSWKYLEVGGSRLMDREMSLCATALMKASNIK
jgi:DNA helicase IV